MSFFQDKEILVRTDAGIETIPLVTNPPLSWNGNSFVFEIFNVTRYRPLGYYGQLLVVELTLEEHLYEDLTLTAQITVNVLWDDMLAAYESHYNKPRFLGIPVSSSTHELLFMVGLGMVGAGLVYLLTENIIAAIVALGAAIGTYTHLQRRDK